MDRVVYNSQGGLKEKRTLLVHVICEDGLDGWGESWANFPTWGSKDRALFLKEDIRPQLLGKGVLDRDAWLPQLNRRYTLLGLQYGGLGVVSQILSAVDIALWDLEGKIKGKPLCALLGEVKATSVKAYASGIDQGEIVPKLQALVDKGFDSFKIRVGFGQKNDVACIAEARGFLGWERTLMVDVNQGWTREEANEMALALADYDLAWLEEPLPADDLQGLAELRASAKTPLAAGENLYGMPSFVSLCEAIPIIQPDVTKQGGITGLLALNALAKEKGCSLIPHNFCAAIGLAATLHYVAAQAETPLLEMDVYPNPLMLRLAEDFPRMVDGRVEVPTAPGLGVAVDTAFLRQYRV